MARPRKIINDMLSDEAEKDLSKTVKIKSSCEFRFTAFHLEADVVIEMTQKEYDDRLKKYGNFKMYVDKGVITVE